MKEEIKLFFLHKEKLTITQDKGNFWSDKFPREICNCKTYYPGTIKLKKDGSIMQTTTTNYYVYTKKNKKDMIQQLKFRIKEKQGILKAAKILLQYRFKRF